MAKNRDKLLDMLDDGCFDAHQLAKDLLGWLSDDDCAEFAHANDIPLEDEEEFEFFDEAGINEAFAAEWEQVCNYHPELRKDKPAKRESFSAFVDNLQRAGRISDDLAQRVTLEGSD